MSYSSDENLGDNFAPKLLNSGFNECYACTNEPTSVPKLFNHTCYIASELIGIATYYALISAAARRTFQC